MRFTDIQIYYLKRLALGVSLTEFRKWDQRSLRGLFFRGLFDITAPNSLLRRDGIFARVTELGFTEIQKMNRPKYRKNHDAPLFKRAAVDNITTIHRITKGVGA